MQSNIHAKLTTPLAPSPKIFTKFQLLTKIGHFFLKKWDTFVHDLYLSSSKCIAASASCFWSAWGVRMEHILRNVLMALLEQPAATLHDVLRIISDSKYRKSVAASLQNETVQIFLQKEFDRFTFGYRADGIAPMQNKIGTFLADPLLDHMLTAPPP